jgi:hypothetical protein
MFGIGKDQLSLVGIISKKKEIFIAKKGRKYYVWNDGVEEVFLETVPQGKNPPPCDILILSGSTVRIVD